MSEGRPQLLGELTATKGQGKAQTALAVPVRVKVALEGCSGGKLGLPVFTKFSQVLVQVLSHVPEAPGQ